MRDRTDNRSRPLELLVLSACKTADGDFPSLDLLVKADRALYEAKELGRDRVVGHQQ